MRHASYIVQCGSVEAVSAIVRLLPGTEHHTENAFFFSCFVFLWFRIGLMLVDWLSEARIIE